MTYVKNIRPTGALSGKTSYELQSHEPPNLSHLRVLGSTVYVLIHEEERHLKSEKFEPRALKGTLVGYDGHTIYRFFIREQGRVIQVKIFVSLRIPIRMTQQLYQCLMTNLRSKASQ